MGEAVKNIDAMARRRKVFVKRSDASRYDPSAGPASPQRLGSLDETPRRADYDASLRPVADARPPEALAGNRSMPFRTGSPPADADRIAGVPQVHPVCKGGQDPIDIPRHEYSQRLPGKQPDTAPATTARTLWDFSLPPASLHHASSDD